MTALFKVTGWIRIAGVVGMWIFFRFPASGQAGPPKVALGEIVRFANFSSAFTQPRHIDIWLPPGFDPRRRYPVLYMHDGQMLFDSSQTWNKQDWKVDETAGTLIRDGKIPPFLIVGIWNTGPNRYSDYFPEKPFQALGDSGKAKVLAVHKKGRYAPLREQKVWSDNYLRFLVKELKPFIDKQFPTLPDRDHTWIAGSSMGGLISWYALCEYPKVFGRVACLSTHWTGIFTNLDNPVPESFFDYLEKKLPRPGKHRLYMDIGDRTLDSLYPPYQTRMDALLRRKGFGPPGLMSRYFPGEAHTEKAWAGRFGNILLFLAPNQIP